MDDESKIIDEGLTLTQGLIVAFPSVLQETAESGKVFVLSLFPEAQEGQKQQLLQTTAKFFSLMPEQHLTRLKTYAEAGAKNLGAAPASATSVARTLMEFINNNFIPKLVRDPDTRSEGFCFAAYVSTFREALEENPQARSLSEILPDLRQRMKADSQHVLRSTRLPPERPATYGAPAPWN